MKVCSDSRGRLFGMPLRGSRHSSENAAQAACKRTTQGGADMSRPNPPTRAAPSYAPPRTQRTNKKAIWSLVLSIITLGGLGSVAGIWLGIVARREIAETGEPGTRL